jgi:XTP/dITP diphosphohydrolase
MVINYVTGNEGKIKLANMIFKDLDVEIVAKKIETPEIQSIDCEEVSKYSAKYAAEELQMPVMKNDSGLCFPALNDFPGALAKYCEDTIGPDGFLRLLEGKDKSCYWVEVISYCEPGGEPISFTSISRGTVSDTVREGYRGYGYDKIFIPEGDTRTFSEMSEEEQYKFFDDEAYIKLYNYLKKN